MSGLAEILLKEDFKISGSDAKPSDLVTHLESLGAKVYIGQRASNITEDFDTIIHLLTSNYITKKIRTKPSNSFLLK